MECLVTLVEYTHDFLLLSANWLQDEEIKKLTDTPNFSLEKQQQWFESLLEHDDYLIWGIKCCDIPIGAAGLKHIKNNECEYWGYIGNKAYWGLGIGTIVIKKLLKYAKNIGMNKVYLHVIENNVRAISLYHKMGFSKIDKKVNGRHILNYMEIVL